MNLILVWLVCQCNVYVIPESLRRKDVGYKGYEPFLLLSLILLIFLLTLNIQVTQIPSL